MWGRKRRRSKPSLVTRVSKWLGLSSPLMLIAMVLSYLGWDGPLKVLQTVEPVPPVVNLVRPTNRDEPELDAPKSRRRSETADSRRRGDASDKDRDDMPTLVEDLFGVGEAFFRPGEKKEANAKPKPKSNERRDVAGFIDDFFPPTRKK